MSTSVVCNSHKSFSLLGIPTYVLLNTSGLSVPARVDHLELLSISGGSLKTIPVKYYPDRKPYGIWNISDFIPPMEAFFLKVMGYDQDDYLFQRVSSVSFSSTVPGEIIFLGYGEHWGDVVPSEMNKLESQSVSHYFGFPK